MFTILFEGKAIGKSALEAGDPPMGVALGEFFPTDEFSVFKNSILPEDDGDPDVRRWIGLSASMSDGREVPCLDVVLLEVDFEDHFEYEVSVLGIDGGVYVRLFPQHIQSYENQFK